MSTHNICFYGEIRKNCPRVTIKYSCLTIPMELQIKGLRGIQKFFSYSVDSVTALQQPCLGRQKKKWLFERLNVNKYRNLKNGIVER